jgi:hypothetical protein
MDCLRRSPSLDRSLCRIYSWVFSETVFSSILWVENGTTNPVPRRVPGALDMAFATLGNDQVVPELFDQMKGAFDRDRPHARAVFEL